VRFGGVDRVGLGRRGFVMSKGLDKKKEQRKKPTRTLEEKRAAKRAKKEQRAL
jgi:hypothetical protein